MTDDTTPNLDTDPMIGAGLSISGASVSTLAVTRDGEVMAAAAPERTLRPASNMKLVTTGIALDRLGPDYRFETRLAAAGRIDGRTLDGDLVFVGSGAPDLTATDLEDLATVTATRFDCVTGDLLLDGSVFTGPDHGPGWTWDDEEHAYGARSTAVALDGNTVTVTITAGDTVSVAPDSAAVDINVVLDDDVASDKGSNDGSDTEIRATTDHDTGIVRVCGTILPGTETATVEAPVSDPEGHCGTVLLQKLATAGVAVDGDVCAMDEPVVEMEGEDVADNDRSEGVTTVASVASAPLSALIRSMNVHSDNFVAEQLARTVAAETDGEGSWTAWQSVAESHFETLGNGGVRVRDGSGLSRYNLLTAKALVVHLDWAIDQPWADEFLASLPRPREGTLSTRLADAAVRAKTGTLTGTCALSGVINRDVVESPESVSTASESSPTQTVLFSVLHGGLTGDGDIARARQDAFVRALEDENGI